MTPSVCSVPLVEISVTDELDLAGLERTRRVLNRLLALRPARLVVDLSACQVLDAAAVGLLLDTHRRLARHDGALTLRDPSERVRRVLRAAGVAWVLPVTSTVGTWPPGQAHPAPDHHRATRGDGRERIQ